MLRRHDRSLALNFCGGLRDTKDERKLVSNEAGAAAAANLPRGLDDAAALINGTSADLSHSTPIGNLIALYKLSFHTNVYARVATGYRGASVQLASGFGPQPLAGQETTISC